MKKIAGALAAAVILISPVCSAQTLEAIDQAEERVLEIWSATPLTFRRVLFVSDQPKGVGQYLQRKSNAFRAGEPLIVYAEPVGYGWRENGDDTYSMGFDLDVMITDPDGNILFGKEDFQRLVLTSVARNREFLLSMTLKPKDPPPGKYVLKYRARDIASDEEGTISLPFSVVE